MNRRLQIMVDKAEETLFKRAARQAGLSTSQWIRQLAHEKAVQSLHPKMTPKEALKLMFSLNAPIADVKTMKAESNRFK